MHAFRSLLACFVDGLVAFTQGPEAIFGVCYHTMAIENSALCAVWTSIACASRDELVFTWRFLAAM